MLEIQIEILRIIDRGVAKPTRIMYSCNINWIPLTRMLGSLLEQEAIMKRSSSSRDEFYITDKGRMILEYYDRSTSMLMGRVGVRHV